MGPKRINAATQAVGEPKRTERDSQSRSAMPRSDFLLTLFHAPIKMFDSLFWKHHALGIPHVLRLETHRRSVTPRGVSRRAVPWRRLLRSEVGLLTVR